MIWILALLVLASGVGLGLKFGAIPTAFSFLGIVFGTLLAGFIGNLIRPLLPHMGFHNPVLIWAIAPVEGFVLVWILFNVIGFEVHRRTYVFYKYKAGDLRLALWERLNSRLGACLGVLTGAAWLVLISFLIFNFTFWTAQVAPGDNEAKMTRLMNSLGEGLESTGLNKAARAVGSMPDSFYKTANFAGLLAQNPDLSSRLGNYPAFLSVAERDDIQQLAQDGSLADAWKQGAPMGAILNDAQVKTILNDTDLVATVWTIIQTNMDDMTNYLITGMSPKFDPDKIIGKWTFAVAPSLANSLQAHPKKRLTATEMRELKAVWNQAFAQTILIAGTDGQLFVKNVPDFTSKTPTTTTENWKGQWSGSDSNFQVTLSDHGGTTFAATSDGIRLEFDSKDIPYVFQRVY